MHPLRRMRRNRGMAAKALAEKAQVSMNTIYSAEAGRGIPTVTTLKLLADALDCSVEDLIPAEELPGKIATPTRREELAQFLIERGFPAEVVKHFTDKAMRDGFITDTLPPEPSDLEDPVLRMIDNLERQWKYLEFVWREFNIYGEK